MSNTNNNSAMATKAASVQIQQQKPWWLNCLATAEPGLPLDYQVTLATDHLTTSHACIELASKETERLLSSCPKTYHNTVDELLLAALLLTFNRWTGQNQLRVDYQASASEITWAFPLNLSCHAGADLKSIIRLVKAQYRAIPEQGMGYGLLRYVSKDAELMALVEKHPMQLAFHYWGLLDPAVGRKRDQFVGTGQSQLRTHMLGFTGAIDKGRLSFVIDYSNEQFETRSITGLAQLFGESIKAVICHCLHPSAGD